MSKERRPFNQEEFEAYEKSYELGEMAHKKNKSSDYRKDKKFMDLLNDSKDLWKREMIDCWKFSYKLEEGSI